MNVFLENKSDKTLLINLNGQNITLSPFGGNIFTIAESHISLNLTTEDSSTSEKNAEKLGYYCFHHFVTVAQYDFDVKNDLAIELYVETKKGDHFEAYQRVLPNCKDFILPESIYTIKDEQEVKEKFIVNEKLENKAEKRAEFITKADRIDTVVSNILVSLLTVALTAIIFIGIWSNFSLKAAIITFAVFILIGYIICSIIKKFIMSL